MASVSEAARWQVYERQKLWLGDLSGAKVLDLGVAMGSPLTEWMAGTAREMHLLDLSEMQIEVLKGWLGFCATCSVGAVANVAVAALLEGRGLYWALAALAGIVVGAVWNYALSSRFVWGRF